MKKNFDEIIEYIKTLQEYSLPDYNELPKIPLYMEQVTTYVSDTLSPLFKDNLDGIISPHRVNNYVKAKILIPPKDKKYDVNHIGYLIFISLLKTSASLRNLAALIEVDNKLLKTDKKDLYTLFQKIHDNQMEKILQNVLKKLDLYIDKYESSDKEEEEKDNDFNKNIANLALKLYIDSEINKLIADALTSGIVKELLPTTAQKGQDIDSKIENIKIKKEAEQLKTR